MLIRSKFSKTSDRSLFSSSSGVVNKIQNEEALTMKVFWKANVMEQLSKITSSWHIKIPHFHSTVIDKSTYFRQTSVKKKMICLCNFSPFIRLQSNSQRVLS